MYRVAYNIISYSYNYS